MPDSNRFGVDGKHCRVRTYCSCKTMLVPRGKVAESPIEKRSSAPVIRSLAHCYAKELPIPLMRACCCNRPSGSGCLAGAQYLAHSAYRCLTVGDREAQNAAQSPT